MRSGSPLDPVPKFGHRNGCNFKLLLRLRGKPPLQIELAFFAADDEVRIDNYCHLSEGALRAFRAVWRSRRHALASSIVSSIPARASARSRPKQTFSVAGTRRATGEPFLSRT